MAEKWPRDLWLDAIWENEGLKPNERAVAFAYARFAGKEDATWCSWAELARRTGIKSKDAIWRAVSGLVAGGWLVQVQKPRQHRSAVYRLTCPAEALLEVRETDPWAVPVGVPPGPEVRHSGARGPAFCDQRSVKRDTSTQIELPEENSEVASALPAGASLSERRPTKTEFSSQVIADATRRRANALAAKVVMDHTFLDRNTADAFVEWLRANRPVDDVVAYTRHLADALALGHLVDEMLNEREAS